MKKLVRLNCALEKKEQKGCTETWIYCGDIEIELILDIDFIELSNEEVLDQTFSDICISYNNERLRYLYQDYDVVYHFPIKSKKDVKKIYEFNLKNHSKKLINDHADYFKSRNEIL